MRRPLDDEHYVVIELDFDSAEAAAGFRDFLRGVVWSDAGNAPGLAGEPRTLLLEAAPI